MDIRLLLTYSDNCCRRLHETLIAYPEAFDSHFETTGDYKTIHALIAHCIGAEKRCVERILGQPRSPSYEECAAGSLGGLFADWDHIRARTRSIIDNGHDASQPTQMHHKIAFTLPASGYADVLTVEEWLFHVFNHQTFHLGQVSMALQQKNISPPGFDYILLHQDADQD
jgi:uncharacterized damage-inducible protein DinB